MSIKDLDELDFEKLKELINNLKIVNNTIVRELVVWYKQLYPLNTIS